MNVETIMNQVKEFLYQFISTTDIDEDLDLFDSGLINSLFAMQLVIFLEKEFAIQITHEDLDFNNFKSLNAISSFVTNKKDAPSS